MKYNFSKSRQFAASFAYAETCSGRRVRMFQQKGDWVVSVSRDNNGRSSRAQTTEG